VVSSKILSQISYRLAETLHPLKIIIFGSQARGTADKRSDVDILVVSSFTGKRRAVVVALDRTLRGLGIARDIILLTPQEFERDKNIPGTIARPAAMEGVVIYERT
jgi:predicted nucleotidyltransferase